MSEATAAPLASLAAIAAGQQLTIDRLLHTAGRGNVDGDCLTLPSPNAAMPRPAAAALALSALAALTACPKPVAQPAPTALHSSQSVGAAVQVAALTLTSAEFEVVSFDRDAGVLTAKRVRGPRGNAGFIACNWARNSISDAHARTALTISLTARPATGGAAGSDVRVTSHVTASFPDLQGTAMAVPDSEDACASNGQAEERLAAALRS